MTLHPHGVNIHTTKGDKSNNEGGFTMDRTKKEDLKVGYVWVPCYGYDLGKYVLRTIRNNTIRYRGQVYKVKHLEGNYYTVVEESETK